MLSGEMFAPVDRRAIVEECFVFKCLNHSDAVRRLSVGSRLAARLDVRGREHLEAALAASRGVVLVTAHFGLPGLIRAVFDAVGVHAVAASRGGRRDGALPFGGDSWTRTRTLYRLRDELAQGHVCVLMADGDKGSGVRVPFFEGELTVGRGAFALARLARCLVLPFFVVGLDRFRAFRIEIGAPLPGASGSGDDPFRAATHAFARLFESYVCRYPGQLYYHDEPGQPGAD
jgi:lauroyl/myristoyl acyltransferase